MLDWIASVLVRVLNHILNIMPQRLNLFTGRTIGGFIYYVSGKRSRIAYSGMKASFKGRYTPKELRKMVKKIYRGMGETFIEILALTKIDARYIEKYIEFEDFHYIEESAKDPKGMIFLSAHFGNWEMSTVASVARGYPLHLLARDQKMKKLNELLNLLRESKGNKVVRKGHDIRNIFRILRKGEAVGVLGDQNAGISGKVMPFFGRPASIAVGPYRFAQKTGAVILPAFIHRKKGPFHKIQVHEPMRIAPDEDITPYMERYNRLLEFHISEHPEQWLWMHKKWKASPLKKLLILDDGKKGHLKQSQSVARLLKDHRLQKGSRPEDVEIETIVVKYKNDLWKTLVKFYGFFFRKEFQGRLKVLEKALQPESYNALISGYADVVISAGSSMHPINKIMSIENHCHNVAIMDPGPSQRKWFDLVVAPGHDVKKDPGIYEKMIVTFLAPNLVGHKRLDELARGKKPGDKALGLLFGGDNKAFQFTGDYTESFADELLRLLEKGYELRGTTSRRTKKEIEDILLSRIVAREECKWFKRASEDNDEETVEKILARSRIVLVSAESVSMVSEAVSSGRHVIVFIPPGRRGSERSKYMDFVEDLKGEGYLSIAHDVKDILPLTEGLSEGCGPAKKIKDDDMILEKAGKVF